MSKPAAERPLWVHQDRLDLPFPAVQGTALLLKARFLLSGMGRCVKFFSLQKGFFFALLLIFPLWEEKILPARARKTHVTTYFILVLTGLFFTYVRKNDRTTGASQDTALLQSTTFQTAVPGLRAGLLSRDHPCKGWTQICPAPRPPPATSREASQNKKQLAGGHTALKGCLPAMAALPADCGCGGRGPQYTAPE